MTIITEEMFPVYRELEHPAVTNAQITGYPSCREYAYPHCPVCLAECEEVYRNEKTNKIIGCDVCAKCIDAWNAPECFAEEES